MVWVSHCAFYRFIFELHVTFSNVYDTAVTIKKVVAQDTSCSMSTIHTLCCTSLQTSPSVLTLKHSCPWKDSGLLSASVSSFLRWWSLTLGYLVVHVGLNTRSHIRPMQYRLEKSSSRATYCPSL